MLLYINTYYTTQQLEDRIPNVSVKPKSLLNSGSLLYLTGLLSPCLYNKNNTTGATSEAGTAYPSGAPEFTPGI